MASVASRELRNQTRALLDRVSAGEEITITVDGRPAAILIPPRARQRWMPSDRFVSEILIHRSDARLRDDLDELAPETTDDLPW